MAVGLGVLALAPAAFWAMTPKEFDVAIRGRFGSAAEAPLSRADLVAMMAQFPDR